MGQFNSRVKESKPPLKSRSTEKVTKKYPLPVEAHMLRQIKKLYQFRGKSTKISEFLHKHDFKSLVAPIFHPGGQDRSKVEDFVLEKLLRKIGIERKGAGIPKIKGDEPTLSLNIIDFPNLVVQKILEFLTPAAILNLRATCKSTKAWIDRNSYILREFEMLLDNELCSSTSISPPNTSPWSNITIPYIHLHSKFVQETISQNCNHILKLEVFAPKNFNSVCTSYPANHPHQLFEIINKCPRIQQLNICRIDSLTEVGKFEYLHIRALSIDRIQWMNHTDFHIFENLIMKCPNLEYLKLPEYEILGSLAFIFYDSDATPEKEHLVRPLMRYLDRYRWNMQTSSRLYIDIVEFQDFKFCSSTYFYDLSRKCKECNAVLMNVYFVSRDVALTNQENIVESFASMFGFIKFVIQAERWKNLEVMECWIEDLPDMEISRQLEFLKNISKIHSLRSLTIRMSVEESDICSAAFEACVGQNYDGVQRLVLRRYHNGPDERVRIPEGFGAAFSNVRYLYIQELDAKNEDFRKLWPGMPNLEELFLFKCPFLTEEAFIIKDSDDKKDDKEQPVLKLKKLQILVLFLSEGCCGFTDAFISKALKFMRLKGFAIRGTAGVEFSEAAMLSLLDTPFHDTIEDFEAPSSMFRPALSSHYWNFYVDMPRKQLRRNRLWLSCSILLNSLSSRRHPYNFQRKCLEI